MPDRFEIKERIQIALKYWNTGPQRDLSPSLGGRPEQSDDSKDQLVSKRLRAGLTRAQIAQIAKFCAEHAQTAHLELQADELAEAFSEGDAAFFGYLANHGPDSGGLKSAEFAPPQRKTPVRPTDQDFEFRLIGAEKDALQDKLRSAFPILMGTGRPSHERPELKRDSGDMQALFFLYRLGIAMRDRDQFFIHREDGLRFRGKSLGLVLRRVPARFIYRRERPYALEYEEYYQEKFDGRSAISFRFEAHANAYAFENFLTVISRDKSQRSDSRLSLMHLDWRRAQNTNDGFIPEVVAMESDCYPQESDIGPTAYRVLLRRVPKELNGKEAEGDHVCALDEKEREERWAALKALSATVRLKDNLRNGITDLEDGRAWGDEKDIRGWGVTPWADYFKRLNVIRCPIDVQLAQYTNFRVKGALAQWMLGKDKPPSTEEPEA